jgi:hypothetical protein
MVQKVILHGRNEDDEVLKEVISGLIGSKLAIAFHKHKCPVSPYEVLKKGLKPFLAKLESLNYGQFIGFLWGLVGFSREKINTPPTAEICLDFAEWMLANGKDKDLVVAFLMGCLKNALGEQGNGKTPSAILVNSEFAEFLGKTDEGKGFVKAMISRINLMRIMAI